MARSLATAGHHVTGVDISDVQVERARRLVPAGTFLRADATRLDLPAASFDAVVCLYALIHMPLADQPGLIDRIATWLRPGGWLLTTVGRDAWTGTEDNWLDGPAAMWWSQADAATYRSWLERAGLTVTTEAFVPEGTGGHTLFWARPPPAGRRAPDHVDIETDDVDAETARLVGLGATQVNQWQECRVLRVPGGHLVCVLPVESAPEVCDAEARTWP